MKRHGEGEAWFGSFNVYQYLFTNYPAGKEEHIFISLVRYLSLGRCVPWSTRPFVDDASFGGRVVQGKNRSRDESFRDTSSKGCIVQGTHCPWFTSSKGCIVQGRIVQGHIVQRTEHPRLPLRGHSGRGRNKIAPYKVHTRTVRIRVLDFYVNGTGRREAKGLHISMGKAKDYALKGVNFPREGEVVGF